MLRNINVIYSDSIFASLDNTIVDVLSRIMRATAAVINSAKMQSRDRKTVIAREFVDLTADHIISRI